MKQTAVSGSTKTVLEEASSEMKIINAAKMRMELAETNISNGDTSTDTLQELDDATTAFTNAGGWNRFFASANPGPHLSGFRNSPWRTFSCAGLTKGGKYAVMEISGHAVRCYG